MPAVPRLESISQSVAISGFTDDGVLSGHIDLTTKLPAGSIVQGWKADVTTRFTGAAGNAAVLAVGTPGEPLAFSANGWQLLWAVDRLGDVPRPEEAVRTLRADQPVRVTVRDSFDFGNVAGGAFSIEVYYLRTEA